jgi:hypothetical protein
VTNPGRLTVIKEGEAPRFIPLHTGEVTDEPAAGLPRDAESVNLNEPLPGETTPVITGNASDPDIAHAPMRVRWVNVLRDPSREPAADNRLIGRYAFWMDDESARLNFNVALGKPAPGQDTAFDSQLKEGFLTPLFIRGDDAINSTGSGKLGTGKHEWALGRPQSINLDLLFDRPDQLQHNKLLAYTFLHGFTRSPEAILDFIDVAPQTPQAWFQRQKFNLTSYSRSPEFNAFGLSRLFTTYIPLSIEGGPSYQHPFIFDPNGVYDGKSPTEILHLNSLLGTFGFTSTVTDEDGSTINGGNVVNKAQIEMLVDYLRRRWPGYSRSFIDKYGEVECRQIAINAALMARMATTVIGADLSAFSNAYGFRTTSVNYSPADNELPDRNPERFYWGRDANGGTSKLMLPQTPGPHITEVRLFVRAAPAEPAPHNNRAELAA